MNDLPPTTQLLIYTLGALLFLGAPALIVHLTHYTRALSGSNEQMARDIATDILEQVDWEKHQTWVNDDTIVFVYIIFGRGNPGKEFLWARVTRTVTSTNVLIEHSFEASSVHLLAANLIAEVLNQRGAKAAVATGSSYWPKLDETGVVALHFESPAHEA